LAAVGGSLREQIQYVERLIAADPSLLERPGVAEGLEKMRREQQEFPLAYFEPHPPGEDGRQPQLEFIQASTAVVAAFAGTRFGKSTVLGVCALRECLPREMLPSLLADTKRFEAPAHGWIMVPTELKIDDSFRPVFQKWTPPSEFLGGSWGKAFNGASQTLRFRCGSTIAFKTYKQDHSTLGGAGLHFVGYDEPPPKKHREEGMFRLLDFGGYEMFAMTPLDTNTGYVRREIFKKRESPDVTVVRGSIHDNPTLDDATRARALGAVSDIYRRAREFGEFVDVGGMIYPDFERSVVREPFTPEFIRTLDVVVGIDPGMRNAGLVWVGFDSELVAHVFDEALLQDKTAKDYANLIRDVNSRWGIKDYACVVDPAAKQRAQANGMTVLAELNKEGVYPNLGQNDHELGFGQMRARMQHGRFLVSPHCRGLRDEADDYAAKEPEEGRDDSHLEPIKGNDHRLDALRYAVLERFWDQQMEQDAPQRTLGFFEPGKAVAVEGLRVPKETHPMGMMF
jgi:hypothetical protein